MPHDTQKYKFPIISILTKNEIRQFVLLVVLVGVTAMLELVSVAAVIPFVSVIIDDALLQQQALTRPVSDWLNQLGLSKNDKVALLSCAFALSFSLACGFRLLAQYLQTKFILNCEKSLSARLLKIYLHKTFASLVGLTASDISASILANVSAVASGVIQPLVTCIAQITVVIVLVTFLLIYDYASTIGVLALVVTTYGFIFKFSGKWLRDAGRGKVEANRRRYSEVATAFSSVRNLKSERMEDVFYSRFLNSAGQYAKKLTMQQFAAFAPRYFVEALLVIATVLVTLANLGESANGLGEMLPKYAAFLMAGYRIAPAMQQIYAATSNMNFNASVLMEIQKLLQNETPAYTAANPTPKFPLSSEIINIEITDLSFRFRQESKFVLKGLNVKLDGRGLIGVMGPSGAGKTTLIDILLGLLPPTEGSVKIGGVDLSLLSNLHTLIGLVPQDLWLFEGTIADNVSLGQSEENKNIDRMREVIRQVGLEAFVEELPRGYQTQVGDRGQLLSGGQRQRIAIARALYKQPQILILDEPTSALDAESEAEVIQTLSAISRRMLVLVISHRRSPLLACDRVIEIRNGSIFRDASKTETEDGYLFLT